MEETVKDPIAEAKRILKEEEDKKIQAFIKEYAELSKKYGLEIKPKVDLIIVPATQEV